MLRVGGLPVIVMNSVTVVVTPSVDSWVGNPGALIDPGTKVIVFVGTGSWGTGFVVDDAGWMNGVGAASEEPNGTGPPTDPRDVDDVVIAVVGEAVFVVTDAVLRLVEVAMLFEDVAFAASISCACSAVSHPISTPVPGPVFGKA